jgi:hypothetical protein
MPDETAAQTPSSDLLGDIDTRDPISGSGAVYDSDIAGTPMATVIPAVETKTSRITTWKSSTTTRMTLSTTDSASLRHARHGPVPEARASTTSTTRKA